MNIKRRAVGIVGTLVVGLALAAVPAARDADAAVILSPVGATLNTLGEFNAATDLGNAIDGSGLSVGFTSGVTDFDTYIGLNPLHDFVFTDQEWFGAAGVIAGTVVFDLGASVLIDRLALWNEDSTGYLEMIVSSSDDPTFAAGVTAHGAFNPAANPIGVDYPAEVFGLTPVTDQYVRLEIVCNETAFDNCGTGEIAFSATLARVPEPASLALLGMGLALVGFRARRAG